MRRYGARAAAAVVFAGALAALDHRVVALPALDRGAVVVTLLLLARGLAGRRRVARDVALVLVALVALVPPHRPERLLLLVVPATVLLAYPGSYVVRPDPRRLRTASAAAAIAVFVILARGVWMAVRHGDPVGRAAHAALPLLPADPDRSTRAFVAAVFAAMLVSLIVALAAAPSPPPGSAAERARVRALAQDPSAGTLAPFASRADKTYVFSPDGAAVIGYRVRFGVALAGGDPVGAAGSADGAVQAFAGLCAVHGWRPAVLGADSTTAAVWRRAGVRRGLEIGAEAVLDVATFSLADRRMRNVRQAVQRTRNAGVRVAVGPLDPALAPRLAPILRDWLHGRGERGFAMNLDHILTPRADVLVAVAYDPRGVPRAFARFALVAGGRALSLDVAPRGAGAPNGVVERLIVEMAGYGREHGAREVSLNFAGMRRVYAGRTVATRLARVPLKALDRWIELRSLYRFTAKFHPMWRPRQLRMRSWLEIVPVGVAALTAEFGQRRAAGAVPVPETAEAAVISGAE